MQNIDTYKDALLTLKAEYQARIDKISDHIAHPQDQMQQHWDDQAVAASRDEMRKVLLIEAEQGLVYVNAALRRIEEGEYGTCVECGELINENRLKAVPYTAYCIEHAR
ncbi:TraR/DksA family transcriptional regulator [Moraxella catarrhalis]|uniref:DnaK suppressor protein n=1 Tax=Moraxella catarrhalis TaxID=480 RepID=A0A198UN16_MORCA|nr:TraR/DksA C4-type zinc finger protein [Moraxella catarrhalis]OAU96153.1 DnaK suppressor protein [Moraxella catarrhalis]OAU97684.1 DnaK suppressor protein [Moraxella catarrhalis]OAV00756.1 DnaK suppressor protein [Moraxella catarrhalis]